LRAGHPAVTVIRRSHGCNQFVIEIHYDPEEREKRF
jgi:hypothetical protein